MKRTITIDIETLPHADAHADNGFWTNDEEFRATALDPNLGRVLCIGWTEQRGGELRHGCFGWNEAGGAFENDETVALRDFWTMLDGFNTYRDVIVGHNILGFDLPFIVTRSIINGIRPVVDFNFARYRNAPIFDTMCVWDCWTWNRKTSLHKLTYALGLASPKDGDIAGDKIYDAFLDGRHREIYEYCMRDVKATRNAYRKMTFTFPSDVSVKP